MGELSIRRSGGFAVPQQREVGRAEKTSSSQSASKPAGAAVPEAPRPPAVRGQAELLLRAGRRTLRTGEAALAEVQDSLGRMAELAREAGGETPDREALQAELEQLRGTIDRILRSAVSGGTPLFLDGEGGLEEGLEALLFAVMDAAAPEDADQTLPGWLEDSLSGRLPTPEELLAGLGLDKTASAEEILAAVTGGALEGGTAAGYLAALYLGSVISGGDSPAEAMEGLRRLLEKVAEGVPLDQAVEELTDGAFTGMEDFERQFTGGTAPGMQAFLSALLLAGGESLLPDGASSLMALLAGLEGANLELLMSLLTPGQTPEADLSEAAAGAGTGAAGSAQADGASAPPSVQRFGEIQAEGRDLSGVSFDAAKGELTVGGEADVTIRGAGQEVRAIRLTGSGAVTLQDVKAAVLTVEAPAARMFSAGANLLGEVFLREAASLTLGGGLLRMGALHGGASNLLRLLEGAAAALGEEGEAPKELAVPVLVEGPASLTARTTGVRGPNGKAAGPADLVWRTLLPGWSSVTAMEIDGRQMKPGLLHGIRAGLLRLWLEKGDPSSQGSPLHTLTLRGRDEVGRTRTRYAYLRWSQAAGAFQEMTVYPNPFTVTGGEEHRDWVYEEESHTLRILSSRVTAISGGAGEDANQVPFSGRVALADRVGATELTLGGVVCRVPSGRAFDLGRANRVTLLLRDGADNWFESGAGCAGISLGEGTSLRIGRADLLGGGRTPAGTLTASGGAGGAGIGRDSGASRDRTSRIQILGGVITASGTGGGAGIGAGKQGAVGAITISGGTITSTGGQGGAGIGGALGAPAGDITIQGGRITAVATHHAAAIGAGVQGACGDILITGTARIVKALGGNPGADIGACLFGGCGKVLVSGGASIGTARLQTRPGVSLQTGEDDVTLPQFRLSVRSLGLDGLGLLTQEDAQAAGAAIDADRRWVAQIQTAYSALYRRLEEGAGRRRRGFAGRLVRDAGMAGELLRDVSRSIPRPSSQAMRTHGGDGGRDVRQLLW